MIAQTQRELHTHTVRPPLMDFRNLSGYAAAGELELHALRAYQTLLEQDETFHSLYDHIVVPTFGDSPDRSGRPLVEHSLDVSKAAFIKAFVTYGLPFDRCRKIAIKALLHDVPEDIEGPHKPTVLAGMVRILRQGEFTRNDIRDVFRMTRKSDPSSGVEEPYFFYVNRLAFEPDLCICKQSDNENNGKLVRNKRERYEEGRIGPMSKYAATHDFLEEVLMGRFAAQRGIVAFFLETEIGRRYLVPENRDMLIEGFGGADKIPEILSAIKMPSPAEPISCPTCLERPEGKKPLGSRLLSLILNRVARPSPPESKPCAGTSHGPSSGSTPKAFTPEH